MMCISTPLNGLTYLVCVLGAAPLFPYLDLPVRLIFAAALVTGMVCDRRQRYPVSGVPATLAALGGVAFYALQISATTLVEPAVNTLTLLLALRLATEKSSRHYLQAFVLALFALAGSSLLSLSAAFFVYLVLLVAAVTIGLVLLSFFTVDPQLVLGGPQLRRVLSVAALLPAVSLVLMLAFFVILPRTQRPLWNFLNPAAATVGFSDKVRPGEVASTAAIKTVAFRAESEKLPRSDLYWRGIVLNTLEETTWARTAPPAGETSRVHGGRRVRQIVYPEPRQDGYLFTLDVPQSVAGMRASGSADLVFTTRRAIDRRARIEVLSAPGGVIEASGNPDRDFYLQVPGRFSARVTATAARVRGAGGDARAKIAGLQAFFRAQQLSYATTDLPISADPVDEFLFEKKRGYCEYFASSFAVLLRLAGVPARLVGGYYGGDYNELGGYYVVTEDTAHVWVEVLTEDNRWLRIDPSALAQNADSALLAARGRGLSLTRRMADAVNYYWNQAVIAYDLGRQLDLVRRTNLGLRRVRVDLDLHRALPWLLAALGSAGVLLLLVRRRRGSAEARVLRRFLRQVRKTHRLESIPAETGLHQLAEQLDDPRCRKFAAIYGGAIYRDRRLSGEELRQLAGLIRDIGRHRKD